MSDDELKEYRKQHHKAYWLKNKEKLRTYNREWRKQHLAEVAEYAREYRLAPLNWLKDQARQIAKRAIQKGIITRGFCKIQGCGEIGEAHHENYDKPLEVEFLCKIHHLNHHYQLTLQT